MTTNEEIVQEVNEENSTPRSVTVLLHILETDGTYQGMTDEEIQGIIDYEKQLARIEGSTEQLHDEYANHCASIQELTASSLQAQETMLQFIVERASNPQLQVIQYG